jgi:ABC-type transport system involved in multi-copper enzyme maturation permease subunit
MLVEIKRVLWFEPLRIKANPVAILAVSLAMLYFVIVGMNIGKNADDITTAVGAIDGAKQQRPELGMFGSVIDDTLNSAPLMVMRNESPLLGLFFLFMVWATPFFAMLMASDQVASELGRKHIRFLLPRVSRRGLFVGRALGAWLTWTLLIAVVCAIASQAFTLIGPNENATTNLMLALRMVVMLSIYSLPFVALMAFWNSFITNSFLSYLLAFSVWMVIAAVSTVGSWANPAIANARFLMPTAVKYSIMSSDPGTLVAGGLGAVIYAAVFFGLGFWIFQSRDV